MSVSDWSTTAAENTTVGPVNIAENCPAANLNNMGREMMAQIAAWRDELVDDYQGKDATLTAIAGLTTAADQIPYATGVDTFAMTALTAFARTLLDDTDAASACLTLGAVRVVSVALASPGHIRFQIGPSLFFQIAWGTFNAIANASTVVNYQTAFPNVSFPVCSGAIASPSSQDNLPATLAASATGFTAYNAENSNTNTWYIAVGY